MAPAEVACRPTLQVMLMLHELFSRYDDMLDQHKVRGAGAAAIHGGPPRPAASPET
jgi:hypothetical protein